MNWGNRIIIVLILFLAGMISMVTIAMQQTNETVEADYYEKELAYQNVIDGKKRLAALGQRVIVSDSAGYIWVLLPETAAGQLDSGRIAFLRLSASTADRSIAIDRAGKPAYALPRSSFLKGWYQVRVAWVNNGTGYHYEQRFQIR